MPESPASIAGKSLISNPKTNPNKSLITASLVVEYDIAFFNCLGKARPTRGDAPQVKREPSNFHCVEYKTSERPPR
jgi:hypothetical protein